MKSARLCKTRCRMDDDSERITWRTLAGLLAGAALIGLVAVPVVLLLGSQSGMIAIRLASALVCMMVFHRFGRTIRAYVGIGEGTEVKGDALQPATAESGRIDPMLLRLAAGSRVRLPWRPVPEYVAERLRRLKADCPEAGPVGGRLTWRDAWRLLEVVEHQR